MHAHYESARTSRIHNTQEKLAPDCSKLSVFSEWPQWRPRLALRLRHLAVLNNLERAQLL
jgi:hypothetical protein